LQVALNRQRRRRESPLKAGRGGLSRREWRRRQSAAMAQEFDVVVVDELSRLTRDPEELARLRKLLRHWQVELVALADGLDTIAAPGAASTIIAIKGLTNEIELEANAHRSRRGLAGRVLAGHHAGGAIYGYRTRPAHADSPGDPPGTGPVVGFEYLIHEGEAEVQRLVKAVAKGVLVKDLAGEMKAAETKRGRLRQEIAAEEGADMPAAINVLPATVRRIVSDLPRMLAAGQVEQVKSALKRLVGKIEVHSEELPGRKRPGAVLLLRGSLEGVLRLADEEIKRVGSPGGILTPLRFQFPPRRIRLLGRRHGSSSASGEQRRATIGA